MKNLFFNLAMLACMTGCTKTVTLTAPGPVLTFKSRLTLTIGDSIKNVTLYPPFIAATTNNMNFLDPSISAVECRASWHEQSETGQPVERGCIVQASDAIASSTEHGYKTCTLLQYQNKETSHFSDGSSSDIPVGLQYYVVVKFD